MLNQDLKVLLISPLPPPAGGIASWTEQYISWSEENKLKTEVVNTAVIGSRAKKINSRTRISDEINRTRGIVKQLKSKINEFKPDVVHLNSPCGTLGIIRDFLCAGIVKKNNVGLVVHYRCNIEDQVDKNIVSKYFLRKLANIADVNLVLNTSSKNYLDSKFRCSSVEISNFINDSFALKKAKKINDEIEVISFVGHVQKAKGIYEILDVSKKLSNITFKLAGPIADEMKEIERPDNVVFLGPITKMEVKELLFESDIFLFPSHTEGFANAMLESMASGLPIIATSVGANRDMIEEKGGIIVEVGSSDSIYRAINMMKDPSLRLRMSEWNIDKVKNEYTIQKVMENLNKLYLSVKTNYHNKEAK